MEYTPIHIPNLTIHFTTDEEGVNIEVLVINGKAAGHELEEILLENHGGVWCREIQAYLKGLDDQCRVDSLLYERAS